MLNWSKRFSICCFMDSHSYASAYSSVECIIGAGLQSGISFDSVYEQINEWYQNTGDWMFGHFNYEYGAEYSSLNSPLAVQSSFPDSFLFVPQVVLILKSDQLQIGLLNDGHQKVYTQIIDCNAFLPSRIPNITFIPRLQKDEYLGIVNRLLEHIHRGDCYEINFCQEFFAENADIDPYDVYIALTRLSPNPFSCFYKLNDNYLLCASPERYLKKTGDTIISQPIKGTWHRNLLNVDEDEINRQALSNSTKDRSENVMVVDLVRNDLSRVCERGSVKVDELFGIYTFPQVHQMISTISGKLKKDIAFADILSATFPMGSMTGAPKKRVMELISQFEASKRGIYSGAVGYISPEKDFDFNVVIRSLVYNKASQYLSYHVGGGITSNSIPEKEYQECLLKADAIRKVFS